MTYGRNQRIAGSALLIIGGALAALVILAQFAIAGDPTGAADVMTSLAVSGLIVRILGGVASLILIVGFVLLALAGRQFGPPVGFLVLAIVYLLGQLFFQFFPLLMTQDVVNLIVPINRAINFSTIAALLFAAVLVAVKGTVGGFARFSLFVPLAVLTVLQFNLPIPYPAYLLPQGVFDITWVIVGVSYLLARPRGVAVTVASENLAE